MDNKSILTGNSGKTSVGMSVANLILARTKLLHQNDTKPSIQLVQPAANSASNGESIIASDRHKQMIYKEALENRDYYIMKQMEDKDRRPWFHYIKKDSQYSEFVMLSTAMAEALLESVWGEKEGNRKVKLQLKDSYRRDMENDRWIPSDEAIGIDYNHLVYNGRHRMTALKESGKEYPFYITFNCLEEAKFTVDSGAKRNSAEKLRLVIDTKMGNRTTGFCKALMRGLSSKSRYTETEIAEFAYKWNSLLEWISEHLPVARAEVQAAIAKAYLWYGPNVVEPFCDRLRDVKFTEDGDPARALFLTLQRAKQNRINITLVPYRKTLAALEAALTNKPLSRLLERDEDIFQWQEGWELPQGSWWSQQK